MKAAGSKNMARINGKNILLAVVALVAISHWRWIKGLIAEMHLDEFWQDFCQTLHSIPPLGKYTLVLSLLALAYLSFYRLILFRRRPRK